MSTYGWNSVTTELDPDSSKNINRESGRAAKQANLNQTSNNQIPVPHIRGLKKTRQTKTEQTASDSTTSDTALSRNEKTLFHGGWNQLTIKSGLNALSSKVTSDSLDATPSAMTCSSVAFVPGIWTRDNYYRTVRSDKNLPSKPEISVSSGRRLPRKRLPIIKPCWQVDSFGWPLASDEFLTIHAQLISQIGEAAISQIKQHGNRLGVCGVGQNSGKSTLAICLARWLAKKNYRTLLIDADIDSASVTLYSGIEQRVSWLECMAKREPITESLVYSTQENLTLAALKKPRIDRLVQSSFEFLSRATRLLSKAFDYLVVDVGDVDNLNRRSVLPEPTVDGAILMHHRQDVAADQVELAQLRMRNRSIKPVAIIKNFNESKAACA